MFTKLCKTLAVVSVMLSPLTAATETEPSQLPLHAFSDLRMFDDPSLSPKSSRLAYIQNIGGENPVTVLATLDLTTGKRYVLLQSDNESIKINWFRWANEETLLISARYESGRRGVKYYQTRLYAMAYNSQGTKPRMLLKPRLNQRTESQFQDNVIDWLPDDEDHVLMAVDLDEVNLPSVFKININNGNKSRLIRGKREIRHWITDQQSNVRVGVTTDYKNGERSILVKRTPESDLEELFTYNAMVDQGVYPLGFANDPNILFYRAYHQDKLALFSIDLRTNESELVFHDDNYDVDGRLIYSPATRDVVGITHSQHPDGRVYWDERYIKLEKGLDQALPDTNNVLVSFSDDENRYIAYTENDAQPGRYFLGDRKGKQLAFLFSQHPNINQDAVSENQLITYKARDGVEIEGYLTLPKTGQAPYPTVMHPHGGPSGRDYDGFDLFTAFFANRGYAVFRPNFRGSTGYGYNFSQSQMKAWGEEMQDDITDGAHYLINNSIADPNRFCIVGASYGGYAATMATVKTPDLFTCAVSFAGVTDLPKLVARSRKFLNRKFVQNQIGTDSDDLAYRSPINHVEKISIPILMIHGDEDRSVHVEQSRNFVEEAQDAEVDIQYIELESGDHYLSIQRNRTVFFEALEAFLQQHLSTTVTAGDTAS